MPLKTEHCVFPNGDNLFKKGEEVGKHGTIETTYKEFRPG